MNLTAEDLLSNDPILAYHLKQVMEFLKPDKVILFGSKARGNSNEKSDTDLAVETNAPFNDLDILGAVDIIDLKSADKKLRDQIMKEGIILYEIKS